MRWIEPGQDLGKPDVLIIPGSKQTIKDLESLNISGLSNQIKTLCQKWWEYFWNMWRITNARKIIRRSTSAGKYL